MKYGQEIETSSDWRPEPRERKTHAAPRLSTCAQCGAANRPPGTRSAAIDAIDKIGLFCTLRCAARYGAAAAARQEQKPVAWGVPNSRPTEKQPFMALLHSPDGCQYPAQLVPLYTA